MCLTRKETTHRLGMHYGIRPGKDEEAIGGFDIGLSADGGVVSVLPTTPGASATSRSCLSLPLCGGATVPGAGGRDIGRVSVAHTEEHDEHQCH